MGLAKRFVPSSNEAVTLEYSGGDQKSHRLNTPERHPYIQAVTKKVTA
jgi:hypothetical protein